METISFVVLAKSYKPGGRCIAGKLATYTEDNKWNIGSWVRPVPDDGSGHGALVPSKYCYENGTEVRMFDVVEVSKLTTVQVPGQPENFLFDESRPWRKVGALHPSSITRLLDQMPNIWLDNDVPTNIIRPNLNNEQDIKQSLCLIRPESFYITLSHDYNEYERKFKKKMNACFEYNGVNYDDISITCPSARLALTKKYPLEGERAISINLKKGDDYVLCLSLSPRFGNKQNHYKLVATVFDFDGYLQKTYRS